MSPLARCTLLVLGLLLGAPAARLHAAVPVDFSGSWRLDIARSDLGGPSRPKPRERVDRIVQRGAELADSSVTVRASGDTLALGYTYRLDRREAVNRVAGQEVRTTARWQGAVLRLESHARLLLLEIVVVERWMLGAKGRELVMERDSRLPIGSSHQRLVFLRD